MNILPWTDGFVVDSFVCVFVPICRRSEQPVQSAAHLVFRVLQQFRGQSRSARRVPNLAESSAARAPPAQVITSLSHLLLVSVGGRTAAPEQQLTFNGISQA